MLSLTYPELATVVLTAVSVLVTVLGVFIAVLAVWGYAQFKTLAREAAKNYVANEVSGGRLRSEIEALVVDHIAKELSSKRLQSVLEARVDRLIYSDAQRRATKGAPDRDIDEPDL